MRGLHFRRGVESIEDCPATPAGEAIVMAIDAALMFAGSRELLTQKQVASAFDMLRSASPLWSEPGALCDILDHAAMSFVTRGLVSGAELVDHLLDLRLAVRAPLEHVSATSSAEIGEHPLVCA